MKSLLMFALVSINVSAIAATNYDCNFAGPNYQLTLHDDESISLQNNLKSFVCQKSYENLPGTEVELNVLNCQNKNEKWHFYYATNGDDIILSRNLVLSKDIVCKKN